MIEKTMIALVLALALAGCGSGGGSDPKELDRFIGTWFPTSGGVVLVCGGQTSTADVTGDDEWTKGTSSDLFQTQGCQFEANVSGDVATAPAGQTCATTDQTGAPGTITFVTYSFTLGAGNSTATENVTGTAVFMDTTGTASCTLTENATYSRGGS